ncbi:hypothetical protein [uncultured Winogradskyella sp.]|uniref:hypothetical protein n=1 Tax=uncultured Winogradskyella sp. TaxID=395353 RepID=UPI0030ED947B|tara:strand:- start:3351 stop:4055 length:705 start_codon:yes stop_codon:yes gene_type:complete
MKINLKQLLVLCVVLTTLGCVTRFEDDTRILIVGEVVNSIGEPIENAQISIYTRRARGIFVNSGYDDYLLGRGYSGNDGEFSVTSVLDLDDEFSIEIDAEEDVTNYRYYTSTIAYVPSNLVYNLNTIELKKRATLNYNITRTSGEGNTLDYKFKYNSIYCAEYYDQGVINENYSYCYNGVEDYRLLTDLRPDEERSLETILGSTVEFTYSINDQPEITEIFTINQPTYEFTFSY